MKVAFLPGLKYIFIYSALAFFLIGNNQKGFAQCENNTPTRLETFGSGNALYSNNTPENYSFSTTYDQEFGTGAGARTQDGEFSFINEVQDYWNVWHGGVTDHTGDPGGYMMLVNASYDPGEFYRDTVPGLCIGVMYEFSVWMGNIDDITNGRITPDVRFEIWNAADSTLLAEYETGDILANGTQFTWQKHALSFVTNTEEVVLLLKNNNPGGSGNDIVLDDIAFTPCLPTYTIDSKIQYCFEEEITLSINQQGTPFGAPEYLWQKRNDLGVWEDIGVDITEINISVSAPSDSGWYRLLVAETGKLDAPACRSKDSIFIDVFPDIIPGKIASNQTICYNTIPALFTSTEDASGSNGIYTYIWQSSLDQNTWTDLTPQSSEYQEPSSLTQQTFYRRMVTTVCDTAYSDTVYVEIVPLVEPGEIAGDQTLCRGLNPGLFTETTPATGGSGPYTYTWEQSDDSISWTAISSSNSATYQSPDITADRWFRRVVADTFCAINPAEVSNPVKLTYFLPPPPEVNDSAFCQQQGSYSLNASGTNLLWYNSVTDLSGSSTAPLIDKNVSGTFTHQVTQTVNSCESDRSEINTTIHPKPVLSSTNGEICLGEDTLLETSVSNYSGSISYQWTPSNGLSNNSSASSVAKPSTTTTYTILVTDSEGCRDTSESVVRVFPKPSLTANNPEICQGLSDDIITAISNSTGTVNYTWTPVTGLSSTNTPNSTASPASTTTYTIIAADSAGCGDTTISTVTVNPKPELSIPDEEICEETSVTLRPVVINFSGGLSYSWSPVTGLNSSTNSNPTASPNSSTTYTLVVVDSEGCRDTAISNVVVNPKPVLSITNASMCQQQEAQLNSSVSNYTGSLQYNWSPATVLNTTNTASVTARPLQNSDYTLIISDSKSCGDTATGRVTVFPKPVVSVTGEDICGGSYADLISTVSNYTGPVSYSWSPSSGLNQTNTSNVRATVLQTSTYTLVVSDANMCGDTTTHTVGVTTRPTAQIKSSDTIICKNETLALEAYNDPNENYTFTWYRSENSDPGNVIGNSSVLNITEPGYYLVEVRNEGFCPVFSERVLVKIEDITVSATANKTILYYDEILELKAIGSPGVKNYQWLSSQGNSDRQQFSLYPQSDALYTVIARGEKCEDSDDIYVKLFPPIIIPNGFSPNGDTKNDQWVITGLESFPDARVKIFNRWGNIVYEYEKGYHKPWEGINRSGLELPSATYYYVIEVEDERKQTFNGSVTILR